MSRITRLAACVLVAGLAVGGVALAADQHNHEPVAGALAALTLDHGAKWQTDAPLRKGMSGIRDDLVAALPAIHGGKLAAEGYTQLAGKVHEHIDYMVGNCKLAPEVDAQLHLVLGEVMAGADTMKSGPERMTGAVKIVQALDAYGRHFAHPGWSSPAH
jgi:hypothetical protein